MSKPTQNIIPKSVVDSYKILQEAKKKKQTVVICGGRNYGKTMLRDLLNKEN